MESNLLPCLFRQNSDLRQEIKTIISEVCNKIDFRMTRLVNAGIKNFERGSVLGRKVMPSVFRYAEDPSKVIPSIECGKTNAQRQAEKAINECTFRLPGEPESKGLKDYIMNLATKYLLQAEGTLYLSLHAALTKYDRKDENGEVVSHDTTRRNLNAEQAILLGKVIAMRNQDALKHLNTVFNSGDKDNPYKGIEDDVVSSLLATSFAYVHVDEEITLKVPTKQKDGSYKLVEYDVKQTAIGRGLPVHLLRPKEENQPVRILIRGTDPYFKAKLTGRKGAVESLAQDIDFGGVGKNALSEGQVNKLKEFIGESEFEIIGHSLGGALAMRLGNLLCRKGLDPSKGMVRAFNAPALDKETARGYAPGLKTRLWFTKGDIISKAGMAFPDTKAVSAFQRELKPGAEKSLAPPQQHTACGFASPGGVEIKGVDISKENKSKARTMLVEVIRRNVFLNLILRGARPKKGDTEEKYAQTDITFKTFSR